jgi:hypothetical protein
LAKRGKKRKKGCEFVHATKRMSVRHDVEMPLVAVAEMTLAIGHRDTEDFKGRTIFYDRVSNARSRWHVLYQDKWYPVVYDNSRRMIVTVLPEGALGDPHTPKNKKGRQK